MADLNNNGIDDADEVEFTRTVKNADGSSQTDNVWRKNRLPAPMQNNMPGLDVNKYSSPPPQIMNGNESSASGLFTLGGGSVSSGFNIPQQQTNKLPDVVRGYTNDIAGQNAQRTDQALITNEVQSPLDQNAPTGNVPPVMAVPSPNTETQYVPNAAPTQAPYGIAYGSNPITRQIDPSSITNTFNPNIRQYTNQPSGFPQQGKGVFVMPGTQDKYNEQLRQIRLNMGIGGAGNAVTAEEKQRYGITSVMNANRGTKKIQDWGNAQLGNLAAGEQARAAGVTATGVQNAQDLAKQKLINEGIVGAAGAKAQGEIAARTAVQQAKIDAENLKNLGEGGWKNFIDPATGQVVPNAYVNNKGHITHIPPPSGIDAEIAAAIGAAGAASPANTGGVVEGSTATSKDGRKIIFKGGKWMAV